MQRQNMNIEEVAKFINAQAPDTKIYIGADSERFLINNVWHADYTLAVVVHYGVIVVVRSLVKLFVRGTLINKKTSLVCVL